MKNILMILGLVLIAGCGVKTVPVITTTDTTKVEVRDSKIDSNTSIKDSTSIEYTKKETEGAVVDEVKTKDAWDSVLLAIQNMPPYTPIVYSDPKMIAQLKFYKDSLNRIHAQCEARGHTYFEKETTYKQTISTLVNKISSLQKENSMLRTEVRVEKERWGTRAWSAVKSFFKNISTIIVVLLILVAIAIAVGKKLKQIRLR